MIGTCAKACSLTTLSGPSRSRANGTSTCCLHFGAYSVRSPPIIRPNLPTSNGRKLDLRRQSHWWHSRQHTEPHQVSRQDSLLIVRQYQQWHAHHFPNQENVHATPFCDAYNFKQSSHRLKRESSVITFVSETHCCDTSAASHLDGWLWATIVSTPMLLKVSLPFSIHGPTPSASCWLYWFPVAADGA